MYFKLLAYLLKLTTFIPTHAQTGTYSYVTDWPTIG